MDRSTVVAQTETVTRWTYELGHVPILCIWARASLAWAVAGKDGIMAGGTSSTAITGASGRLICVFAYQRGHHCHQEVTVAVSLLIIKAAPN